MEARIQEQCQGLMNTERVPRGGGCPRVSQRQIQGHTPCGECWRSHFAEVPGCSWKPGSPLASEGHWTAVCPVGTSVDTLLWVIGTRLYACLPAWALDCRVNTGEESIDSQLLMFSVQYTAPMNSQQLWRGSPSSPDWLRSWSGTSYHQIFKQNLRELKAISSSLTVQDPRFLLCQEKLFCGNVFPSLSSWS